ncbi:MAG: LytR C-terminal domain-containing protein [Acidimicrobiia bacterium]|nr:LytR C-terminal domain-containing protein [Acidimicrobiia bacterium]
MNPLAGLDGEQQKVVGGFLVGLAVVLGFVLLVQGFNEDGGLTAAPTTTTTIAEPEIDRNEPPTLDPSQTTTTVVRPPAEVQVVVANATGGTVGAAGTIGGELEGAGYDVVGLADAAPVASTQVLYAEGFEPDADAVAAALGADPTSVAALPDPPPVPDLQGAQVVVLVGPELVS